MSIKLESGVPIPPVRRGLALPFGQLEVNESFSMPVPNEQKPGQFASKVRSRAMLYAKRHGGKFLVRIADDDEESGRATVRCWRTR